MSTTIPTQPVERVGRRVFTIGDATWVYDVDLITAEQAITADECLNFKLELQEREADNLNQIINAGGLDWFPRCAGALLRSEVSGVTVPHDGSQWLKATQFVRELPYAKIREIKECMADFFTSIERTSDISYAFNAASKKRSRAMLSAFMKKEVSKRVSEMSS